MWGSSTRACEYNAPFVAYKLHLGSTRPGSDVGLWLQIGVGHPLPLRAPTRRHSPVRVQLLQPEQLPPQGRQLACRVQPLRHLPEVRLVPEVAH